MAGRVLGTLYTLHQAGAARLIWQRCLQAWCAYGACSKDAASLVHRGFSRGSGLSLQTPVDQLAQVLRIRGLDGSKPRRSAANFDSADPSRCRA